MCMNHMYDKFSLISSILPQATINNGFWLYKKWHILLQRSSSLSCMQCVFNNKQKEGQIVKKCRASPWICSHPCLIVWDTLIIKVWRPKSAEKKRNLWWSDSTNNEQNYEKPYANLTGIVKISIRKSIAKYIWWKI